MPEKHVLLPQVPQLQDCGDRSKPRFCTAVCCLKVKSLKVEGETSHHQNTLIGIKKGGMCAFTHHPGFLQTIQEMGKEFQRRKLLVRTNTMGTCMNLLLLAELYPPETPMWQS